MHLIGFSHHYTKLHNQTYGWLLSVRKVKIDSSFPSDGRDYDTEYMVENTNGAGRIPIYDWYHVPNGTYLQLTFIGDSQIPFTTYRKVPEKYKSWKNRKPRCYKKSIPYSDLIGQDFAFKFKGEKLPPDLESSIDSSSVKIFK